MRFTDCVFIRFQKNSRILRTSELIIKMAYQDWHDSRAWVATFADWFEKVRFLNVLYKIRDNQLNPVVNRIAALELLNSALSPAPYDKTVRFPENVEYICDVVGTWCSKFARFRMLCGLQGLTEETDNIAVTVSFRNLIGEMIQDAQDGLFVLDQRTFENWGEVTWALEDTSCAEG